MNNIKDKTLVIMIIVSFFFLFSGWKENSIVRISQSLAYRNPSHMEEIWQTVVFVIRGLALYMIWRSFSAFNYQDFCDSPLTSCINSTVESSCQMKLTWTPPRTTCLTNQISKDFKRHICKNEKSTLPDFCQFNHTLTADKLINFPTLQILGLVNFIIVTPWFVLP